MVNRMTSESVKRPAERSAVGQIDSRLLVCYGRRHVRGLCTESRRLARSQASKISIGFVLFREISCNFVDRVIGIRSHTIHEITLSSTNEHELRVFVQSHVRAFPRAD